MAAQESDRDESTSFEVDRHVDEQPPREDLLDAEEIEFTEDDEGLDLEEANVPERTGEGDRLPDPEDLPETQGLEMLESERLTEDDGNRPPLHDEEE